MTDNSKSYNVCDYISEFLVHINCLKVHGLMGGGASGLNDGFIRNSNINYLCYHHEQSAGYAAIGETRLSKSWSILNPTTGCGGTNCYTPVLNAWQDSLPIIVISGNVNLSTCSYYLNKKHNLDIRTYGVQEHDIITSVYPITKYSKMLDTPESIDIVMQDAFVKAASNRKGPSWIDVPADLQHSKIPYEMIEEIPKNVEKIFTKLSPKKNNKTNCQIKKEIISNLQECKRPLVLIGGGITNDKYEKEIVNNFIRKKNLPVVTTYAGTDVISHDYEMYLGAIGIKGNRAANFAVQNCDLLLVLGSRLPFAAIGYDIENFAKHAKICVVDVDDAEVKKNVINFSGRIFQTIDKASNFLNKIIGLDIHISKSWKNNAIKTKSNWSIIKENKKTYKYKGISIYHVIEELNKSEYDNCNFVSDAGSISYVAPTSLKYNNTRNFIFSPGQADMGCALPSALGVAASSKNRTICITGDGSFMSNLQELSTLSYHDYNMTVVVLNNSGYLSITNTQKKNYGENRVFGEHDGRGLSFPNYEELCKAFSLKFEHIKNLSDLKRLNDSSLKVVIVNCLQSETVAPYQERVNGKQAGAHDMAPFRQKEELKKFSSVTLKFER